jgi:GR25 family glycosyltransferase involved in LPS biosynthesis
MINEILHKNFDRIYCINLSTRPDRWEAFQKEMDKFGIKDIIRFDAINGKELDYTNMVYNKSLLAGEVGILLTHLKLIEECKRDNIERVLIMEDDLVFTEEIVKLGEYLDLVPNDYEFLYFGANHNHKSIRLLNDKIGILNHSYGLQCVAIKNTVYDKILIDLPKIEKQVDAYYADYQPITSSFCFVPNMALQRTDFSDIQNRVVDYTWLFKNF